MPQNNGMPGPSINGNNTRHHDRGAIDVAVLQTSSRVSLFGQRRSLGKNGVAWNIPDPQFLSRIPPRPWEFLLIVEASRSLNRPATAHHVLIL